MCEFDRYAHNYDAVVNRALAISGEDMTFFAKGRILFLSRCLEEVGFVPRSVLDYGCGTGTATPLFFDILGAETVVGVDLSPDSLEVARRAHTGLRAEYKSTADYAPSQTIDLAFCNGVFHHIQPERRAEAARYIASCVRPGGLFALWENNTRNPGVRHVMSRHPFDRDAIPLCAREARGLTCQAGLDHLRTDYCFFFPRFLSCLRALEPYLAKVPLGAQFQVLAVAGRSAV